MRVTTWNVNGLRAALKKGFAEELARLGPDVLLLQEVRAFPEQLPGGWGEDGSHGWTKHFHPAEKPGYAGVAVFTRGPSAVSLRGLCGPRQRSAACPEGRVLGVRFGGVEHVSVYLPSGSSSEAAQARKDAWLDAFAPFAARLARRRTPVVLGGDLNIAHGENDIHNPVANRKSSGFLPHERSWFGGELLASGWRDEQRHHAGDVRGPYSWWSNRGRARTLDRGWRIDYLLTNRPAAARSADASTDRAAGLRCSDHAPVSVDLRQAPPPPLRHR
ncbi:exodeoxyribonuclease III [Phycisphaera mikurensis]|nr:exodeoxyribonuclease III [Phycisphaera mikurensis]MBB6441546.1 exodeoxyribonuclease-3 [Phycisphaera mikurensis]